MPAFYLSATRKSSGKTTIGIGLCRALQQRSVAVQPFKKGPDYIDPMWLAAAAKRPCINLDFNTMSETEILGRWAKYGTDAEISIIEGNKGLFDGVALEGADSNAAMAELLGTPVLLVLDGEGLTRGVAPLLLGYQHFGPELNMAGVILNNLGGSRHESKIRNVIEHYTDIQVLGAIQQNDELLIRERHLGLVPRAEAHSSDNQIEHIAAKVAEGVNIEQLTVVANRAVKSEARQFVASVQDDCPVIVAVARDSAFCFYYHDDLSEMQAQGATLKFFSPLEDKRLPVADALFLGGGFPETHAARLSHNTEMREAIKDFAGIGGIIYAECGGLMYLSRGISWKGRHFPMVGIVPGEIRMHKKPLGRGHVQLTMTDHHPWKAFMGDAGSDEVQINAHEFHYASLENVDREITCGWDVKRGYGLNGAQDGLIDGQVVAGFSHLRNTVNTPWVAAFLASIRQQQGMSDQSGKKSGKNHLPFNVG